MLAMPLSDREEESETESKLETTDPKKVTADTLTKLPSRVDDLTERLLPRVEKPMTDTEETDPMVAMPVTLKCEPSLATPLSDRELPKLTKPADDIAAPVLNKVRIDIDEPRFANDNTEILLDITTCPKTEAELPSLATFLTESDDPRLVNDTTVTRKT